MVLANCLDGPIAAIWAAFTSSRGTHAISIVPLSVAALRSSTLPWLLRILHVIEVDMQIESDACDVTSGARRNRE